MTIIFFLLKYLYRELYPRVLECILQTESSEMILSNKDEILETLNIVATDAGNKHCHVKKKLYVSFEFSKCKVSKRKGSSLPACHIFLLNNNFKAKQLMYYTMMMLII